MLTNHHTHSLYSDGSSKPEEYITAAISKGFRVLGFTEHSPLPFKNSFSFKDENKDEYTALLTSLKQKHSTDIALYSGMEMDFIPGVSDDFSMMKSAYKLDYMIGSVHLVKPDSNDELWFIDGSKFETYDKGLNELFGGDIKKAVTAYYFQLNNMIETEHFDIVGHVDKIKMHNADRYFKLDEAWYMALVNETLGLIQDKDLIIEINTRGIYKKRSDDTYPGLDILRLIKQLHIPVMVNSDAHHPDELDGAFEYGYSQLKAAGIKETVYYNGRGWAFEGVE